VSAIRRCVPILLLVACVAADGKSISNRPVAWTVRPDKALMRTDGLLRGVILRATIKPGWHVYSLTQTRGGPVPMKVQLDPSPPFTLSPAVVGPRPQRSFDSNFGIETETYSGTADFHVPIAVAENVDPAGGVVTVRVRYQACSDKVCMPARTETLTQPLRVATR